MRNLEYLLLHDLFPVYYVDALSRLLYAATLQVVVCLRIAAYGLRFLGLRDTKIPIKRERNSLLFSSSVRNLCNK